MSKANSPVLRGLPTEAIAFDTITTHDWADVGEWPTEEDSSFVIEPAAGKAMVLSGVLVRFSENMAMVAGNAMHIEGVIADGIPAVSLATFARIRDYVKRADVTGRLVYEASGGDFTKPVIELKLDFSAHVFLWSSAGMTPTGPKVDKLGIPKFRRLLVRMGANLPLRDKDGGAIEIAASRYFAAIYADPDYVP